MVKTVAIHQPNLYPWLGYFEKIARSHVFVFLDHVQFSKTGGTWSNRARMRMGGRIQWVSAPIRRSFHGVVGVNAIEWDNSQSWREKLCKSLAANYGRTRFYGATMRLLEPLIMYPSENLADFNIHSIKAISQHIGLNTDHFVRSSELDVASRGNDMLIELTKRVDGQAYLCGGGAGGYQDDAAFKHAGLQLIHQQFSHPVYTQGQNAFEPGLSIIDALMHVGANEALRMLRRT